MTSPSGLCLETLLEAAKFLEQQEQQLQQKKETVVAISGTPKICESDSSGPPLLSAKVGATIPLPPLKQEELPSADDAKKPSPPSPSCYTNGLAAVTTATPTPHPPPAPSVITPLSPAVYNLPSTTTIINSTTHLSSNHISFTSALLHHQYVERLDSYSSPHATLLNRAVYPVVHMEDELMENAGEEGRLLTQRLERGSYTSSSSSSLAGSVISTSPNGCQSAPVGTSEMIKKRSGISGIREVHNKLEKNRRAHLKECFEILKRTVPPAQDEKKSSNLSILGSAIRYIQFLRRREREFEHEMERLAREKIHAQQRLAHLKKELSARWEHIDFNTLIPDAMEVDAAYDHEPRDASLLSYGKDRSYMEDESELVVVTNGHRVLENGAVSEDVGSASSSCELSGGGGGAERVGEYAGRGGEYVVRGGEGEYVVREGESWRGGEYVVRGGESWRGGETLYSSSSSLSSTMSPLHHHGGLMTSQTQHIQVMTSSSVHPTPASQHVRLLPGTSSDPAALTPLHNGGLKSSPPPPPPHAHQHHQHHHLSPSSASLSPLPSSPPSTSSSASSRYPSPPSSNGGYRPAHSQSTCQSSVIQSSSGPLAVSTLSAAAATHGSNGTAMPHLAAVFNGKTAATPQMNGLSATPAATVKSADNMGGNAKLVSLNSLPPGLIAPHHHNQLVFTSQQPKLVASTGASTLLTPALLNKPLPSLQPISSPSPHQLLLKSGGPVGGAAVSLVNGARILLPHAQIATAASTGKSGAVPTIAVPAKTGAAHGLVSLSIAVPASGKASAAAGSSIAVQNGSATAASIAVANGIAASGSPVAGSGIVSRRAAAANGLVSLSGAAKVSATTGSPLVAVSSLKPAAVGPPSLRLGQK